MWAYTPRGNFIVCKAYRLAMGSRIGNTFGGASNEENGKIFWKTIWRLNIPNKVKSFAWKASKNIFGLTFDTHGLVFHEFVDLLWHLKFSVCGG